MLLDFILLSELSRIQTCFLTKSMHLLVKLRKHLKGGDRFFYWVPSCGIPFPAFFSIFLCLSILSAMRS
jgi:hypothetical protein